VYILLVLTIPTPDPWFSRVTNIQQPLIQAVTKRIPSTESPKPRDRPLHFHHLPIQPITQTPWNSLTVTIAAIAAMILHEADMTAIVLTELMTEVRDDPIRKHTS
jgi:hypothetical protein